MIYFKSKHDTEPSKLASAIAHNIEHSDIEISCMGVQAVNATVKALVVAKKFIQNKDFNLKFDFFLVEEENEQGELLKIVVTHVSKENK